MIREHHLYCAIAKYCFLHAKRGITFVRDPLSIASAKRYGLEPLILYGVSAAGTSLKRITLSTLDSPLSFSAVLEEAWKAAPPLRGKPERIRVNRYLNESCPQLKGSLANIGVELLVADAKDKLTPTSLRSAQEEVLHIGWGDSLNPGLRTISQFNAAALAHLEDDVTIFGSWSRGSKERTAFQQEWLALPIVAYAEKMLDSGSWSQGPWLSTWEKTLPPDETSRVFNSPSEKRSWLFVSSAAGKEDIESGEDDDDEDNFPQGDDLPRVAKAIADCWPTSLVELGKAIGSTQKDLQWFFAEKSTLGSKQRHALITVLGLELNESYQTYEADFPRVLIASSPRKVIAAYDQISHGGDLRFSFEAVPTRKAADPSWRYLVMASCGGHPTLIMFPRGSACADKMDSAHLINFNGVETVTDELYQGIVQTCAQACKSTADNVPEAIDFCRRWGEVLDEFEGSF